MNPTRVLIAVTSAMAATAAFAGGLAAPVMEEVAIVEEATTSSSSAGLIIPLILIALIALALSRPTPATVLSTVTGLVGDDVLDFGNGTEIA